MANQAPKAQIHFTIGRHDSGVELGKSFDQMRLSLHRQNAIGREPECA
jgi:hypothetical protein